MYHCSIRGRERICRLDRVTNKNRAHSVKVVSDTQHQFRSSSVQHNKQVKQCKPQQASALAALLLQQQSTTGSLRSLSHPWAFNWMHLFTEFVSTCGNRNRDEYNKCIFKTVTAPRNQRHVPWTYISHRVINTMRRLCRCQILRGIVTVNICRSLCGLWISVIEMYPGSSLCRFWGAVTVLRRGPCFSEVESYYSYRQGHYKRWE